MCVFVLKPNLGCLKALTYFPRLKIIHLHPDFLCCNFNITPNCRTVLK